MDILLRNAKLFDGTGAAPQVCDVAVAAGRIQAIGKHLQASPHTQVIEVQGRWLMPGLLDIHTHLDLEVELAPALPEVLRHGSTTVIMSNCSLGVTYGHQRRDGTDPIVDCFARVENIPKHVLRKVGDACTWRTSAEYLEHFKHLPLGPNVVPLIPHSMLRIEVMGLRDSVERNATPDEINLMADLLERAMQEGYAGFSSDGLPFHFLAHHDLARMPS
jgi:N-acyl-D-aspartate/D-glutamate deacylase